MQHCEKCNHDAKLLDGISGIADVDYYRCPVCGEVWTAPKDDYLRDTFEHAAVGSGLMGFASYQQLRHMLAGRLRKH